MNTGFHADGFALLPNVFSGQQMDALAAALDSTDLRRSRAGLRHALQHPAVAQIANSTALTKAARAILGPGALAFRATLFDKSPTSNWLVVWHQDTALPLKARKEVPSWGPWSEKDGVTYAHAPASALAQVVALRVHLDESTEENGPLRVIPGTHDRGVLSDSQVEVLVASCSPVTCTATRGSVLAMRPLLIHASSKCTNDERRRVLHIEYAATANLGSGIELATT